MAVPGNPSNVSVALLQNNIISWDAVTGAVLYNLYWKKNKVPNCYFVNLDNWVIIKKDSSETAGIVSSAYRMIIPDGIDARVTSDYSFLLPQQDFVITLDITDYNADNHAYGPQFRLSIRPEGDHTVDAVFMWFRSHLTNTYFVDGLFKVDSVNYNVTQDNLNNYPTKVRIVRSGTILELWYYILSWIKFEEHDFSTRVDNLVEIELDFNDVFQNGGNITADNLIITSSVKDSGTKISNVSSPYEHISFPYDHTVTGSGLYCYEVTAENDDGESLSSLEVWIYIYYRLAADVFLAKIILLWTKPFFEEGSVFTYNIYWLSEEFVDDPDALTPAIIKSTGTKIANLHNISYFFEPRKFDIIYYFVITSVNEFSDESNPSNHVNEIVYYDDSDNVGEKAMQDFYYEMTYRINIAADINQRTEQVQFWSNEEILRSINEGYLDFVRRTMCLQKFTIIGLVAEQAEYDLPSDCIKLLWVSDGTRNLVGQSLDYMDDLDPGWLERDGTPSYYVQELAGIKKFNLYETPETSGISTFTADTNDSAADADHGLLVGLEQDDTEVTFTADSNHTEADADHGIVINLTGEPVMLSEEKETGIFVKLDQQTANLMILYAYEPVLFNNLQEAQTPDFLAAYHLAIVNFAVSELYLKEGETQNIPLSDFYRGLYEDAVQSKLETRHVSNLKLVSGGSSAQNRLPPGPHLPYDQYPAYRR